MLRILHYEQFSQVNIGFDFPICYYKTDVNKTDIEIELLLIYWETNFCRTYVFGKKFIVVPDYWPLIFPLRDKNPSSKMIRKQKALPSYRKPL